MLNTYIQLSVAGRIGGDAAQPTANTELSNALAWTNFHFFVIPNSCPYMQVMVYAHVYIYIYIHTHTHGLLDATTCQFVSVYMYIYIYIYIARAEPQASHGYMYA